MYHYGWADTKRGIFCPQGKRAFSSLPAGRSAVTGSKALPPVGEAGRFAEGEEQNRKVLLGSAAPPPEEISSKAPNFPPLIIYGFPDTEKPVLRVITSDRNRANPRPQLFTIHYSLFT